uniref:Uncharacterized protein n=1 Tax=Faecalibaculum rodentium TaxID=1702221 RepID=A0A140DXP3_9FIRM|nr:hypothetical protein AALO17_22860 [Faecalibaculum rodentium]
MPTVKSRRLPLSCRSRRLSLCQKKNNDMAMTGKVSEKSGTGLTGC